MLNISSWNCSQNPSSQRMKRGKKNPGFYAHSTTGITMQKEKEQRKGLHGFTVSYLREGVIGADCSAALQTLGCAFVLQGSALTCCQIWEMSIECSCHIPRFWKHWSLANSCCLAETVDEQMNWCWLVVQQCFLKKCLRAPDATNTVQYCTVYDSFLWCFAFACFCLQILVSASSASLSWWFQNKNCAAGQRGCWMTETSAWRLLGAAACLTARRFPWKKQRSQRPRHHSCPKLWQLCVIMHQCISYIVITHVGQTLCTGQLNLCLW